MEIEAFNLEHQLDMELSKASFPYFFQHVLGWEFAKHQEEWLENLNARDYKAVVCYSLEEFIEIFEKYCKTI